MATDLQQQRSRPDPAARRRRRIEIVDRAAGWIPAVQRIPGRLISAISFVGDLEIVIQGTNKITGANGATAITGGTAEDGTVSTLAISGDGSLTVSADGDYGISCSGEITVTSATLDITGAKAAVEGGASSLTLGEDLAVAEDTGVHLLVGAAN